ncbi:ankyrin repeat-containing domain protein, partial [Lentinula raphanica]
KLQDWLAAPNCSINYSTALNKRALGTGQWILKDPVYLKWREQGGILWLQGQGNKFTMTSIIQNFKTTITWSTTLMIYHYFDTRDNSGFKTSFQGFVSSLLLQLGAQNEKIHPILQNLHKSSKNGLSHSMPTNDELEDTLIKITEDLTQNKYQVHIVIDALDECKEVDKVWASCVKIANMQSVSGIIISSRNHQTQDSVNFTISLKDNLMVNGDIAIFIDEHPFKIDMNLHNEVKTKLMNKADGGFRYVDCQIQTLKESLNAKRIHKALTKLPSNLEQIYFEAIQKCESSLYSNEAQYILSWILYAFEPLYMRQVEVILSIDLISKEIDSNATMLIGLEKIIDTTLVTVDNSNIVQLAHASVKDFLLDSHNNSQMRKLLNINAQLAHNIIGQMCLIYLLGQREYKPIWKDVYWMRRKNIVTFEQYAIQYWGKHSQYNEQEEFPCEDTIQLTQEFLHNKKNWKQIFWEDEIEIPRYSSLVTCSNLYIAACYGLKRCMQKVLIDDYTLDSDINVAQGGFYSSVIQAAAAEGYKEIVELVLQHGADVNIQGGGFGTAIVAAAFKGLQDIVECLVQQGADINFQGKYYGTAIAAAANKGHQGIVEYLVQHGADINLYGDICNTAITAAALGGHQNVVEYLAQHGANINLKGDSDYGTVLEVAASKGYQDIVEYLIQHGANINLKGGKYGTALAAAASEGHQDVVEYLVQHGADINLQGGKFGTAIAAAAYKGHQGIIEYLVQYGADINLQSGTNGTAIEAAAFGGYRDIFEHVLPHGGDLKLQGG